MRDNRLLILALFVSMVLGGSSRATQRVVVGEFITSTS